MPRPSPIPEDMDGEDNLLAQQKEFMADGKAPAAKLLTPGKKRQMGSSNTRDVVSLDGLGALGSMGKTGDVSGIKKSVYKQRRANLMAGKENIGEKETSSGAKEETSSTDSRPMGASSSAGAEVFARESVFSVLSDIKEKDFTQPVPKKSIFGNKTMPVLAHRSKGIDLSRKKGPSTRSSNSSFASPGVTSESSTTSPAGYGGEKNITNESIDKENRERLASMSAEEIEEARAEILSKLDSGVIEFLKARKSGMEMGQEKSGAKDMEKDIIAVRSNEESATDPLGDELKTVLCEQYDLGGLVGKDSIEKDKLEWIVHDGNEQKKKEESKDKQSKAQIRFDFEGRVISKNDSVSPASGLFHHGNEPGKAGYSLGELIHLTRSTVPAQRALSLNVLSCIIRRAKKLEYVHLVEGDVVSTLIDLNIVLILRCAVDDSSNTVIIAAVRALREFIVDELDETFADQQLVHFQGYRIPQLSPPAPETPEGSELTDIDVANHDLVRGLLNMKILPRLRYILEVCRLRAVREDVLDILIRFCRHSPSVCEQVVNCPRLISVLCGSFIDAPFLKLNGDGATYECVIPKALKLIRCICQMSCNLSSQLLRDGIFEHFHKMLVISPSVVVGEEDKEIRNLQMKASIESFQIMRIVTEYGLHCSSFIDLFPIFRKHFEELKQVACQVENRVHETGFHDTACFSFLLVTWATSFIAYFRGIVNIAAEPRKSIPTNILNWGQVSEMFNCCIELVGGVCEEFHERECIGSLGCTFLGGLLYLLDGFMKGAALQIEYSPVETLSCIEKIYDMCVRSILTSSYLQSILDDYKSSSWDSEAPFFASYKLSNLPSFCSGMHVSLISQSHFMGAIYDILFFMQCKNKAVGSQLSGYLGGNGILKSFASVYANRLAQQGCEKRNFGGMNVVKGPPSPYRDFVHRTRNVSVAKLLRLVGLTLANTKDTSSFDIALYVELGLFVLNLLGPGDEVYVTEIVEKIICNCSLIEQLGFSLDYKTSVNVKNLLEDCIGTKRTLRKSEAYEAVECLEISCLTFSLKSTLPLPSDWMFLPAVNIHNTLKKNTEGNVDHDMKLLLLNDICAQVQFWLDLEKLFPAFMKKIKLSTKLCRWYCVFLISDDLFHEPSIAEVLHELFELYIQDEALADLTFTDVVGVSFYDYYVELVEHFLNVSYGHQLFGRSICLPLRQMCDPLYKQLVWSELSGLLRVLPLTVDDLPGDIEGYLYPIETDLKLLSLYSECLSNGICRKDWCPALYYVAIHHLSSVLFGSVVSEEEEEIQKVNSFKLSLARKLLSLPGSNCVRVDILSNVSALEISSFPTANPELASLRLPILESLANDKS
eukprot:Nk52_evm56s2192 gene=Nk52_evmTU56s2192